LRLQISAEGEQFPAHADANRHLSMLCRWCCAFSRKRACCNRVSPTHFFKATPPTH